MRAPAPPYGRLVNVKEEIVTTRTRTIAALAALSFATSGYIADDLGSGMPEAAAAPVSAQAEGYLAGGSQRAGRDPDHRQGVQQRRLRPR